MKKKAQATKENQPLTPNKSFKATASKGGDDINELILRDHKPLKALIETLKDSDLEREDKEDSFEDFVVLLTGHAKAEEQSLYVAIKEIEELKSESYKGDTEHAIAEQLMHEINGCPNDKEWMAKVKVLAELVEHHIEDEENEMLKEVEENMDIETRRIVGAEYSKLLLEFKTLNFKKKPRNVSFRNDRSARF